MALEHEEGRPGTSVAADESRGVGRRWRRLAPWQQGLAVLAVGVIGFSLLFGLRANPAEIEPPRQIPTVTTVEVRVESGAIRVRGGGTVRPSAEVVIAPQVSGRVAWVAPAFLSGGRFSRGQRLLRVDPADYENAVRAAEAEVAQRQVGVLEAEEEVALARAEWERVARREGLDPAPGSVLVSREPQLEAARAMLRGAEARLADAQLALDRTWIRAPFDGIVREETVDAGQFIVAGQRIGTFYASAEAEIVVPLSDDEAVLIAGLWELRAGRGAGIPAEVTAEFGGRRFSWSGYVDRAEGALDEQTRTVDVVVRVPRPFEPTEAQPDRPPLLIGSYASADIEGATFERYLVVPAAALRDDDVVWTLRTDTLLVMTPVELIQEVEGEAYVLGDLEAGARVIVSSLPFVTDGMTVRAVERLESVGSGGAP